MILYQLPLYIMNGVSFKLNKQLISSCMTVGHTQWPIPGRRKNNVKRAKAGI